MSWDDAVAWADSLEFAGHTEWRLPSNETLGSGTGVWCSGYCSDSEMGYMYHVNFGLRDVGGPISNTGPFINLEANVYWTGTANDWDPAGETAWEFSFATGNNYAPDKSNQFLAWAVHEGDIGAVIPLPAAAWLFVSGLLGLIGAAKCKKNI